MLQFIKKQHHCITNDSSDAVFKHCVNSLYSSNLAFLLLQYILHNYLEILILILLLSYRILLGLFPDLESLNLTSCKGVSRGLKHEHDRCGIKDLRKKMRASKNNK